MRVCYSCKKSKPLSAFVFRKSRARGNGKSYPKVCKLCNNETAKVYYHKNRTRYKETRRAWAKAHWAQHRKAIVEWRRSQRQKALAFLGNKCIHCGETDWECLQIDHIDGGGCKEFRKIGPQGIVRKVLKGAKDYQLLCANCNWRKRYRQGGLN